MELKLFKGTDFFPLVTVSVKSTPLNKRIRPLRQHLLPPSPVQRQETSDHQCSGPNVSDDSLDSSPFHAQEEMLTSSSWTDQASDFRQEIRQSNYRNDPVKYDLKGQPNLGSAPSTDLSCSPWIMWIFHKSQSCARVFRVSAEVFKGAPGIVFAKHCFSCLSSDGNCAV